MGTERQESALPERFRSLFWDCEFDELSWEEHRNFIIRRILSAGSWEAVTWLRAHIGDDALREWMLRHRGRGLDRRRIRFWELILDLPAQEVDDWLADPARRIWDNRRVRG